MKKSVFGLLVGLLAASVVAGNVTNDYYAANKLAAGKEYDKAIAAYQRVIADYPQAMPHFLVYAQVGIGRCLWAQGRTADAQAAFEKAVSDYPTADAGYLFDARMALVGTLFAQRKYEQGYTVVNQARTTYGDKLDDRRKVTADFVQGTWLRIQGRDAESETYNRRVLTYPKASVEHRSIAWFRIYQNCKAQGKLAESNAALVQKLVLDAGTLRVPQADLLKTFDLVMPGQMTAEAYTAGLTEIIKITPAVEEYAQFLGRLKSELSKME